MGIMMDDEWASKTGRKSVGRRICTNNLIAYERHFGIASTPCMDWITFIDYRHTLLYMDLENEVDKDLDLQGAERLHISMYTRKSC